MDEQWPKLLSAIGSILSAIGAGALVKGWVQRREKKKENKTRDVFRLGFQVSSILHQCRLELGGHRGMILVAHNGGEDMNIQKPVYSSLRFQTRDDMLPSVLWDKESVDEGYWRILKEVSIAGSDHYYICRTSKMEEGSKLKDLYLTQGIEVSYIFMLFSTSKEFWYVSITLTDIKDMRPEPEAAEVIRSARNFLTKTIKEQVVVYE